MTVSLWLAVQLAKAAGAHVTAVASAHNEDHVRSLGADDFIDCRTRFLRMWPMMDVIFDTVGGDTFERAFSTLKNVGFLVTAVAFPKDEAEQHGVGAARVFCKPNADQLASISELVEAGKLKGHFATVFPLANIKQVLALSEVGQTRGKIVLQIIE